MVGWNVRFLLYFSRPGVSGCCQCTTYTIPCRRRDPDGQNSSGIFAQVKGPDRFQTTPQRTPPVSGLILSGQASTLQRQNDNNGVSVGSRRTEKPPQVVPAGGCSIGGRGLIDPPNRAVIGSLSIRNSRRGSLATTRREQRKGMIEGLFWFLAGAGFMGASAGLVVAHQSSDQPQEWMPIAAVPLMLIGLGCVAHAVRIWL